MATKDSPNQLKNCLFSIVVVLLFLALLECSLRLCAQFFLRQADLDPYEVPNSKWGWSLKPGYCAYRYSPDSGRKELLVINSKGFRGKEFTLHKDPNNTRVIVMGDSVTFGIVPESCPYPAQLQRLFNKQHLGKIEVINAGVEGYSSENVLNRLRYDILQYQPDILIVYVGWNDLYSIQRRIIF